MREMQGIDVSKHNGLVDWKKVKNSGKEFAFIRIGWSGWEGEIHLDERFHENIKNAMANDLKVGIYVYAYNKHKDSAIKTAKEIIKIIRENGYCVNFPIAFDIEETNDKSLLNQGKDGLADTYIAFAKTINNAGYNSILYTYTAFMNAYVNQEKIEEFNPTGIWVADYREQSGKNCPYTGKKAIWQYRGETGRCDGVAAACDLNVSYIDFSEYLTNIPERPENPSVGGDSTEIPVNPPVGADLEKCMELLNKANDEIAMYKKAINDIKNIINNI